MWELAQERCKDLLAFKVWEREYNRLYNREGKRMKSEASILLEIHLKELGITFQAEFQFAKPRKWRFDYLLWLANDIVALEIEGGIWTQGRHTRGRGYQNDLEKYREATRLGFKVYRFSSQEVLRGIAREFLQRELDGKQMPVSDQINARQENR